MNDRLNWHSFWFCMLCEVTQNIGLTVWWMSLPEQKLVHGATSWRLVLLDGSFHCEMMRELQERRPVELFLAAGPFSWHQITLWGLETRTTELGHVRIMEQQEVGQAAKRFHDDYQRKGSLSLQD